MKKFLAYLLAMVLLVACVPFGVSAEGAIDYSVNEDVTITFWMTLSEESKIECMQKIIDDFEASQEHIKVNMIFQGSYAEINTALVAANVANTDVPGCIWTSTAYLTSYANNGVIEDLTPYIEYNKTDVEDFVPAFLEAGKVNGASYAFPMGMAGIVGYYNHELLESLNLTFPKTWDEMGPYMEKIYNATGKPAITIACWGNDYLFPFYYNIGCEMLKVDENGKVYTGLADEKAYELTAQLYDWTKKGWLDWRTKAGELRTAFTNGDTAGIMYYSSGVYSALQNVAEFTVKAAMPVDMGGGMDYGSTTGSFMCIPANQDQLHKNAAYQFMAYFTGAEHNIDFALGTSWLPTRHSAINDPEKVAPYLTALPGLDVPLNNIGRSVLSTQSNYSADVGSVMRSYIMQAMNDELPLEDAWEIMLEEINDLLNDK